MIRESLYTNDGRFVAEVGILPFLKKPEMLHWGERFFLLRADGRYTEADFCYAVPILEKPPIWQEGNRATTDGEAPDPNCAGTGAPKPIGPNGQHEAYYVLPESDRKEGLVRPVRCSYKHLKCGFTTSMTLDLAETYAKDPSYYGRTFCSQCRGHFPVGVDGEFEWVPNRGETIQPGFEKVGS